MNPILVDSCQCHLWTDVLHVRQLARDSQNRWDRGTYVRLCVVSAWTALEVACQEALNSPEIGYKFKVNLDRAVSDSGLKPLDWSRGIWQDVRRIQELRKSYIHKFAKLADMFSDSDVADDAVMVVRSAIASISAHAGIATPTWLDFDHSHGWAGRSGLQDSATATLITGGASLNDPTAVRIYFVADGVEHLSDVYPKGTDVSAEVDRLVRAVRIPITAVRVYEGNTLARELLVYMRGSG